MTPKQREIQRKRRLIEYAERVGNVRKACRYYGVAMASGAGDVVLPKPNQDGAIAVERAIALRRSVRAFAPEALPLSAVSQAFRARDTLRAVASAGALYPLEVYLVAGNVSGVPAGVYRYEPRRHRLVLESAGDARAGVAEAALGQGWVAEAPAILALAAVYERTARKYGERAERYVHMEVGHAAQNVYLQAGVLGLGTTIVGAFRDEDLARALGFTGPSKLLGLLPVGKPR